MAGGVEEALVGILDFFSFEVIVLEVFGDGVVDNRGVDIWLKFFDG